MWHYDEALTALHVPPWKLLAPIHVRKWQILLEDMRTRYIQASENPLGAIGFEAPIESTEAVIA